MQGKMVYYENNIKANNSRVNINLQHLSDGFYQINLSSEEYKHSIKIVINK
jgi:hypothetical protein